MSKLDTKKKYHLLVNSFEIEAEYFEEDIQDIFIPLLSRLSAIKKENNERVIVFIAAPPGVGKTTLSLFLERLSKESVGINDIQAIGIDGFHYPQDYILKNKVVREGIEIPMKEVKGSPETFNLTLLKEKIMALKEGDVLWPIYDRKKHDVVADQVLVNKKIVIIEGNWLLLDEDGWRDLSAYCDYCVFITAQIDMLRSRLIERKIKGGLTKEEAVKFCENSDLKNVNRALKNMKKPNMILDVNADGKYFMRR